MTIADILGNEDLRRHEFPVCQSKVFLAHAGVCPLPRRVAEAVSCYVSRATTGDQESASPAALLRDVRALAARLIQAQPDEIALVGPTSLALSFVAGGLPFSPRDNVLVYRDDYPSNVYPWMALAEKNVEVRFLRAPELGRIGLADVIQQVDERTRLVALASCHYVSGWRIDLEAIGRYLRGRGIAFCVDGIQTLGAFPTPVAHVDFLAADAHKWMLGPCGAGVLYVRKDWQERLRPTAYGWHNVRCLNFIAEEQIVFKPDARRYEAGTANLAGLAGLKASLEMLLQLGLENIAAELLRKRNVLAPRLREKGCELLAGDAPPAHAGGITTFYREGTDMPALHQRLAQADVFTSLRADRSGRHYIRLSPHFYNTDDEMERVLALL